MKHTNQQWMYSQYKASFIHHEGNELNESNKALRVTMQLLSRGGKSAYVVESINI